MRHRQRRRTIVLEVAALMIALVSTSGWIEVSPFGGMAGVAILLFAASISRLRHYLGELRRSSTRVPHAPTILALAIAAFIAWKL